MKPLLSILFIAICSISFSQTEYTVNQEINYFDGLNWVESQIIKIENGKYFVYTNREKTKTKWVTKDDFEALYTEVVTNRQLKINVVETIEVPILQVGDSVMYNSGNKWLTSQISAIDEARLCTLVIDSVTTIVKNEQELTLLKAAGETKYKVSENKKTIVYSVGEIVEYKVGSEWKVGEIKNISDEDQLKINDQWYDYKLVRKAKR
ncbi:MAG: hypothetical protein ACK5B9_11140 [Flavobacteriia bacterium]|jgi:hypothetical protein